MPDISTETPSGILWLPAVGDFIYEWTVQGDPLPEDSRLYFAIGKAPVPALEIDFTITDGGMAANIKIESTAIAPIKPGTTFWLMLMTDPDDPDTKVELLTGQVKKKNAR